MRCLDTDLLADYADGLCDGAVRAEVERHLIVCDACRHELRAQRDLLDRLRAVPVDGDRHASLVAGLMELHEPAQVRPLPARRGPGTVAVCAPPQYVSARRSVACALFAAVGCVGVALVAAHVPADGSPREYRQTGTVQQLGARTGELNPGSDPATHLVVRQPIAQVAMLAVPGDHPSP